MIVATVHKRSTLTKKGTRLLKYIDVARMHLLLFMMRKEKEFKTKVG